MAVARYEERWLFLPGNKRKDRFITHPASRMLGYGEDFVTEGLKTICNLQTDILIQHGTRHYATCSVAR